MRGGEILKLLPLIHDMVKLFPEVEILALEAEIADANPNTDARFHVSSK